MLYAIIVALMIVVAKPVLAAQESKIINKHETQAVEKKVTIVADKSTKPGIDSIVDDTAVKATDSKQAEQPVQKEIQSTPVEASVTCEQAIRQVWPRDLQDGAIIVSQNENRNQNPAAIGSVNPDKYGSRDYGCFQINDHWHPAYFTDGDWSDPIWAAKYALMIYQGRQSSNGNGWSAWYAVQGILW